MADTGAERSLRVAPAAPRADAAPRIACSSSSTSDESGGARWSHTADARARQAGSHACISASRQLAAVGACSRTPAPFMMSDEPADVASASTGTRIASELAIKRPLDSPDRAGHGCIVASLAAKSSSCLRVVPAERIASSTPHRAARWRINVGVRDASRKRGVAELWARSCDSASKTRSRCSDS